MSLWLLDTSNCTLLSALRINLLSQPTLGIMAGRLYNVMSDFETSLNLQPHSREATIFSSSDGVQSPFNSQELIDLNARGSNWANLPEKAKQCLHLSLAFLSRSNCEGGQIYKSL